MPAAAVLLSLLVLGATPPADARITRIVLERTESPTFGGARFEPTGPYEKLVGRAFGEVDPEDPANAVIADVARAPRNTRGRVEYAADLYLLRPVDPAKGNGKLLYEVNNRGNKLAIGFFNGTAFSNDPSTAEHAGNGFLMREGYTLAWLGWDLTAASGNNRLTITLPVATQPDGAPIVGPAMEEFMIDNATTLAGELTYPAASLDTTRARLTARARRADARTPVPADAWEYASPRSIRLLPAGTPFQQGMLYELVYPATEPRVAGLGFAATRDFVTFLRGASRDDAGTANPLAGRLAAAYAFGISQGGRYLRDLLYLGFNRDEAGRQFIPLRPTKAERLAVGDPRSSIEERYPTHASYVGQVARAAYRLVRGRLLLEEDAQRLVEAAVDKRLVGGH